MGQFSIEHSEGDDSVLSDFLHYLIPNSFESGTSYIRGSVRINTKLLYTRCIWGTPFLLTLVKEEESEAEGEVATTSGNYTTVATQGGEKEGIHHRSQYGVWNPPDCRINVSVPSLLKGLTVYIYMYIYIIYECTFIYMTSKKLDTREK